MVTLIAWLADAAVLPHIAKIDGLRIVHRWLGVVEDADGHATGCGDLLRCQVGNPEPAGRQAVQTPS
ncbi:MAG: hypothetical protein IPI89_14240 [Propionivibrio sp.]|nr:hypothetical protein [Propionivibrio sp.]